MAANLNQAIQANTVSTIILEVIGRAQAKLEEARALPEDNDHRKMLVKEVQTLRDEARMLSQRLDGIPR
ncbi:hypothetical protein [Sandarakinorhabdus sp.]|uniref:hypothetical protein n=1 Tax=Sandarakinorhabdus sp. TaxID=1916663 RepID=UPI003F6FBC20